MGRLTSQNMLSGRQKEYWQVQLLVPSVAAAQVVPVGQVHMAKVVGLRQTVPAPPEQVPWNTRRVSRRSDILYSYLGIGGHDQAQQYNVGERHDRDLFVMSRIIILTNFYLGFTLECHHQTFLNLTGRDCSINLLSVKQDIIHQKVS